MQKIYDSNMIQKIYEPAVTYEDGCIHILKVALIITHNCTLRCKLCAERTPYYEKRYHPSLEYLKNELDRYFELVDYTMKLEISGGEPLTRTDLPELLIYLLQYRKHFGRVRIITNGTIKVTEDLIHVLKQYGKQADMLIDCYSNQGKRLSVCAEENKAILDAAGIACILRKQSETDMHCGGWVDFGALDVPRTDEKMFENFRTCAIWNHIGGGVRMREGIITPCAVTQQLDDFGIMRLPDAESLDLFDDKENLEEKRNRLYRMFQLDGLSACRYCNGMSEASERYAPAEQLK